MNICLLGNNLTNLVLANILIKNKINVEIIQNMSKFVFSNSTRTIAISNENYNFLKKNIKGFNNLGWPTEKIKIYSEKNQSSELFEFKNKKQNNFYLIKYNELNNLLKKNKFLKIVKIKKFNYESLKKKYDLIINSDKNNIITKKYFYKKIEKDYRSLAHSSIISHKKTKNNTAVQIFTKNGPLAFLPLSNTKTSVVYSNNSLKPINNDQFIEIIRKYNLKYEINKIIDVEHFKIKFSVLRNYVYKNILSFGDLIHNVHPLAGQGFNMTVRDIKCLIKILDENINLGIEDGEAIALKFQNKTRHLNFLYGFGIDSINTFFKIDNKLKNYLSDPIFKLLKGNNFLNNYATILSNRGVF